MAVDKLVDSTQLDADLTTVANAIRTKGGTSAQLAFPAGFASAIAAIPTGGGGLSNVVTGTFKGTTTEAAMDVTLNYNGNGYPVVVSIVPKGGYLANETFAQTIQRYAEAVFLGTKTYPDLSPDYDGSGNEDIIAVYARYKSSSTNATSYSGTSQHTNSSAYNNISAASSATTCVKFKNKNTMSVYIASTSYGFMANVEYEYRILYSS